MFESFRQSMTWLHTWYGLVLGYILMVVFFFGTLSVFDREIDRWAIPETRFEPQPMPSFDDMLLPILETVEPSEANYNAQMPFLHDSSKGPMTPRLELPAEEYWAYTTHRDPVLIMGAGFGVPHPKDPDGHNHVHGNITIDPRSGTIVSDDALKIGSRWFYPMHYGLHLGWKNLGYWLVGLASFTMLIALVTGIVMHRKVFREFFTFRPHKKTQRSALDLHNMTGVLALPFHFFFSFTGLVIFASWLYFPVADTLLKPLHNRHEVVEAEKTGLPHKRAGIPAGLASVDAMVTQAKSRWAERGMAGEVGFLTITHFGDQNGYVSIFRAGSDRVALVGEGIHFKASTGALLREDPPRSAVASINEFLTGLHLQHFEHWLLRWLYVLGGLFGCVCIATGFVFFVEKRKQRYAQKGSQRIRLVDSIAVATVTGLLIASTGMLVANRLIPADLAGRDSWEKWAFWGFWLFSLLHALVRSAPVAKGQMNPAWREQCFIIGALALSAVGLNWLTTGDHLLKTLFTDTYWPVAGVDLSLLVTAGVSLLVSRKLKLHKEVQQASEQTNETMSKGAEVVHV